jgi:hypothetical protein
MRKVCSGSSETACRVNANPPASELHILRDLLSDIYDPLTSAVKRQPHVHPIVRSCFTRLNPRINSSGEFRRLFNHLHGRLNMKSMPFSFPSLKRMGLYGSHLSRFPKNGTLAASLQPFSVR